MTIKFINSVILYAVIPDHGFVAELLVYVVFWDFCSKILRFRLEVCEGVEKSGGKGQKEK